MGVNGTPIKWPTVLVRDVKWKPCNFEWYLCRSFHSTFKTSFQPYTYYNKQLQTLFKDQLNRSKATCSFKYVVSWCNLVCYYHYAVLTVVNLIHQWFTIDISIFQKTLCLAQERLSAKYVVSWCNLGPMLWLCLPTNSALMIMIPRLTCKRQIYALAL